MLCIAGVEVLLGLKHTVASRKGLSSDYDERPLKPIVPSVPSTPVMHNIRSLNRHRCFLPKINIFRKRTVDLLNQVSVVVIDVRRQP